MLFLFFAVGLLIGIFFTFFISRHYFEKKIKRNWNVFITEINQLRVGSRNLVTINQRLQAKLKKHQKPITIVLSNKN